MSKYAKYALHEVVQFVPGDKWADCIGWIDEIKEYGDDTRYTVAVPIPGSESGITYRFSMESKREFGRALIAHHIYDSREPSRLIAVPPFLPAGAEDE